MTTAGCRIPTFSIFDYLSYIQKKQQPWWASFQSLESAVGICGSTSTPRNSCHWHNFCTERDTGRRQEPFHLKQLSLWWTKYIFNLLFDLFSLQTYLSVLSHYFTQFCEHQWCHSCSTFEENQIRIDPPPVRSIFLQSLTTKAGFTRLGVSCSTY